MKKLEFTFWMLLLAAVLLFKPIIWVGKSFFEARAFNKLTGSHATTWDAMWSDLRVQNSSH